MPLKHKKTSVLADGPDTDLIRPSDWNAEHQADFAGALAKTDSNGSLVAAQAGTDYLAPAALGTANGVATLNAAGTIPTAQLPVWSYIQSVASDTWIVNHNLNRYPNVAVHDSSLSNELVFGTVVYTDLNTLIIRFAAQFTGEVHLS